MSASDHDAVLKRFAEVASREYPFSVPEDEGVTGKSLCLTSWRNLQPLLTCGLILLLTILSPPLYLVFTAIAVHSTGLSLIVAGTCASLLAVSVLRDVFFLHWVTGGRIGLGGKGAREGIFCKSTQRNDCISEQLRHFAAYRPTPYLWSGDLFTLVPYLLFKGSVGGQVNFQRWWIRVPSSKAPDGPQGPWRRAGGDDDEAVALDVAFPAGGHRAERPAFLLLHGLNGGSAEPYLLDLVRRAIGEGSTVAVMIARGLMSTPVRGLETFHGARTSDVACTVDALLHALGGERRGAGAPTKTRLILVGFSMGGIVAANYSAKAGAESGLAGAISFSGCLCCEKMLLPTPTAQHSLSHWQRLLGWSLKGSIVQPHQARLAKRGITLEASERPSTIAGIDAEVVSPYHGYATVRDYYADMSSGGRGDAEGVKRLAGAKIPLLVVHAIDDPILNFESSLPEEVACTENVLLLATKHGGHIGWPQGWSPSRKRWDFMVDIAMTFASILSDDNLVR